MIASTQINTEIFVFIAVLIFKLLSHSFLFINQNDNIKTAKVLQSYKK